MIRKLDHIVITTEHMLDCVNFYTVLGFRAYETSGRWELLHDDFKINLHYKGSELEPKARHVQSGSTDICMELKSSLSECIEQLTKNGILIEQGIVTRHGIKGEMKSIYVRDPDENLIELCSYE